MTLHTAKPIRSSFAGRSDGHEAFFNALHRKAYAARGGKSSPRFTGIPIHVDSPYGRQCAGYVVVKGGRRVLRKTNIRQSVHYCRKHSGYGVEPEALKKAEALGATAVRLAFADGDRVLEAPISTFAREGIRDALGGFGVQVFLPTVFWHVMNSGGGSADGY